ncbi:MAG: HlyD family efflux transporter periplasmic adaptor subunit [Bacteroidales bacterium]|jgi:HlyD family secretion protein|nr:HlyD family efflux transporter periplasmic adaptor subunit [Bacteroidales bacterium]
MIKEFNLTIAKFVMVCFIIMPLYSCQRNGVHYDASGTFETTEIIVSSEATGKILYLDINEGDEVTENQLLGVIDTTQLYLSKLQLQSNIKAAKTRKTNVNTQIAVFEEQLSTAKKEKQRIEKLLEANAANSKDLDDINAQIALLDKQIAAQRSSMVRGNMSINEESSALEIQIAQLDDHLEKSYIISPINGIVLVKYSEKGEMATQGKALFKVANTNEMILRAYVSAGQFTELKLGQEVKVFADFGDKGTKEYNGVLTWISEKAEFTPKTVQTRDERSNLVYAVKIAVKNDGYLKIGMYAGVNFN